MREASPSTSRWERRKKDIYKPILVLGSRGFLVYLKVGKERDVLESCIQCTTRGSEMFTPTHTQADEHLHRRSNLTLPTH